MMRRKLSILTLLYLVCCVINLSEGTDRCASNPCQNGATCVDIPNNYICSCAPGFLGTNCQVDMYECASGPCQNGGTCIDLANSFTCSCAPGFQGTNCETSGNPVATTPPLPDSITALHMTTPSLTTPAHCDGGAPLTLTEQGSREFTTPNFPHGAYPINARCRWLIQVTSGTINLAFPDFNFPTEFVWGNVPCATTKVDVFDGATTSSRPLGTYCENTAPPNVTSSTGTSMLVSFTGGAFARNGHGFRATFTVIGGNPVPTTPLLLDSTTALHMTSPSLTTPATDECASNPCHNGATCQDAVNSYTCTCPPGYEGNTCATVINDCAGNPCQNGGTCTDRQFFVGYFCTCPAEYGGTYCDIDLQSIDECASNPCQHGSTCLDALGSYTCSCAHGFQGTNCETDIDECASNPCQNMGTCTDLPNSYICSCAPGFQGTNCETDADRCASNPCENGATCVDIPNNYICSCAPGFLGTNCQVDMYECASGPCQNGGTCIDLANSYTCSCVPGYQGTNCETAVTTVPPTTSTSTTAAHAQTTGPSTPAVPPETTTVPAIATPAPTTTLTTASTTAAHAQATGPSTPAVPPETTTVPALATPAPTTTPPQSTTVSFATTRTTLQADTTLLTHTTDPSTTTATTLQADTTKLTATTPEPTSDSSTTARTTRQMDTTLPYVATTQPTDPPHTTLQEDTTRSTLATQTTSIPQVVDDCASNPCQNGGTCTDRQFFPEYYCTCAAEYGGTHCEIAIATIPPATTTSTSDTASTVDPVWKTTEPVTESTRHPGTKPVTSGKPGSNGQQNGDGGLTEDEIILYAVLGAALALILLVAIIVAVCLCRRGKRGRYAVKSREQELEKLERLETDDNGIDNPAQLKAARPDSDYQSLRGSRPDSDYQSLQGSRPDSDYQSLQGSRPDSDYQSLQGSRSSSLDKEIKEQK